MAEAGQSTNAATSGWQLASGSPSRGSLFARQGQPGAWLDRAYTLSTTPCRFSS